MKTLRGFGQIKAEALSTGRNQAPNTAPASRDDHVRNSPISRMRADQPRYHSAEPLSPLEVVNIKIWGGRESL